MVEIATKSREHKLRVLANQERLAAELAAPDRGTHSTQLKMPLIVEVKSDPRAKPRSGRGRRRSKTQQPGLGEF